MGSSINGRCPSQRIQRQKTYHWSILLFMASKVFVNRVDVDASFIQFNIPSRHKNTNNRIIDGSFSYKRLTLNAKAKNGIADEDIEPVDDEFDETLTNNANGGDAAFNQRRISKVRTRVKDLARKMIQVPLNVASTITPMPQAVAAVLKDATLNAVDMAVEEVLSYRNRKNGAPLINGVPVLDVNALIEEAFLPVEASLDEMEQQLRQARISLRKAKQQAITALEAVEVVAMAQAEGAIQAVKAAEEEAGRKVLQDIYDAVENDDNEVGTTIVKSSLSSSSSSNEVRQVYTYENIDYSTSEMAAPFIGEDQCLVLGEPIARVEKAPENSRRIFAGIDIPHSVDDVWCLLTDYPNLQNVVPNLVVNEVLEEYRSSITGGEQNVMDASEPEDIQCKTLANKMKGSKLRQIGGAKIAGIQFSARTTLEVREWPNGLPDFAHFNDEYWDGKSRKERMIQYSKTPLTRYKFPRPFALSSLPTRDISMQNIDNDDGEFRMYQGVWRMQPLPGCAPPGKNAMRLTYAVEVSPRAYLPVQLIEKRIVSDLCNNLVAIRDYLAKKTEEEIESLKTGTSSR